ncbi:LysR family transcriptional regulator [Vibrio marisflavi]|uniref:HTH-type transcriptional regulator CysL n=1 Tax=Vibrio marisflavi CECT 7928 TaxID=634439 RepID=A0ABM8ZZR6_9VIBR|nr:LysR family transcriptional regulator [Vibrio marisflavi]CAH0536555.1 HTH-type transcriptional regulator CysL [Vibrio marisflavi CECT 7928]
MFSMDSLEYFVSVVQCGSFTAAAEQLSCSTSTVSRHIHQLESDLLSPVFTRHTRKVVLTDQGRLAYEKALRICEQVKELKNDIALKSHDVTGLVRVNGPNWIMENYLVPILPKLHEKWPCLQLALSYEEGAIDPYISTHDVYLCEAEPMDSSLVVRSIASPEFWACASPKYLSKKPVLETPDDLKKHSLLSISRFGQVAYWVFNYAASNEVVSIDTSKSWLTFTNYTMGRTACLNDGGITLMPRSMVERDVLEGKLCRVLSQYKIDTIKEKKKIHLVYTNQSYKYPKVKAVIDNMIDCCF